ncbi:glycoside hydrolase family 88/105 protein [Maribacter sp. 2210JD10-5]|uniref:glycoside hydrolase family 88/105 protein n=1 Tax=Maribacter sp. 2210JD10-5 TaxID=3386272 RepID=UPI0039BD29C5
MNKIIIVISLFLFQGLNAQKKKNNTPFSKNEVLEICDQVAQWEIDQPFAPSKWNDGKQNDWVYATFWTGLSNFHAYRNNDAYLKAMFDMGRASNWEPMARPYDANSHLITYTHCGLFEITKDSSIIEKSVWMADMPLLRWIDEPDVTFADNTYKYEWWTWCDALFMAPPAYARLGKLLDKPEYFDFMSDSWWATSEYLYNPDDRLFYRDDTYFDKKTKNGKPVYWSRGNGWVLGGLCLVLDYLPKDYKTRPKFEKQFKEMAEKIAALQTKEGYWPASLLDAKEYPEKETSGTAFFCYALAWGVNNGYLEKDTYHPIIEKSWKSLVEAVHPDGKLGFVQQIGHAPGTATFENTQSYGTGALLLAGTEILKMMDAESTATKSSKK